MADSIKIRITGDDSQYSQVLEGLGGKAQKAFGGVSSVMKGMLASQIVTKGFSMLTGTVRDAISAGMDFGAAMSQVAAVSGAEGDELKALTAKAKEMGAETQFSASQAAEAMNYMAMAGWKTEEMLGGIEGIMNLAAAAGEDLGTTSDIVTDALTAFGMQASDAGHFADILAAASSNANTNVSMMGETFKYVAPLAGALGYTAEDMAAAIGLMANSGIKGSQAGTALRGTLTRLSKPTKESAEAMDALDLSITDSSGKMKPFMQIMEEMRDRFAGLSESEKAQYAAMIAGQEGMSGLLAIVNASEADFEKLTGAIDGCDGAAEKMAKVQMDNLAGDVKLVKSAFEGLQLAISESTNGMARDLVQGVNDMLTAMNQAYAQGGMDGMIDAFGKEFPKLLTKVISVLEKLVAEITRKLPDLLKQLVAALPGILESLLADLPQIAENLFAAVTAIVEQLISDLPRLVPMLVQGVLNLAGAVIKGIATSSVNLTEALFDAIFGNDQVEYDSLGQLDTELTYDVSTSADVDNSGAQEDVDAAFETFKEELRGYGLTDEQIAEILAFKGTQAQLEEELKKKYPNLTEAQRNAIVAKFKEDEESDAEIADSIASELDKLGLSPELIAQIIGYKATGNDAALEALLKKSLTPDLYAAVMNVIKTKWNEGEATGAAAVSEELSAMGLTDELIFSILGYVASGDNAGLEAMLMENCPELYTAVMNVIKTKWAEGETANAALVEELKDIGLTDEMIRTALSYVASGDETGLTEYLKGTCPNLYDAAMQAIKAKWNDGKTASAGSAGAQAAASALEEFDLSNEDIANIIGWYAIGDTASIAEYLAGNGCPDITQAVMDALEANWDPSAVTLSSGVEDTSVNFVTKAIVDMFTNGIKEDDPQVQAALETAQGVIDAQKRKLIDYINSGQDTDGKAAEALGQLNELEAALTTYAANYATATTDECRRQGEALTTMAQQCQDTVDSITAQSERLISVQERLFNAGVSGSKLTDADLTSALSYIAIEYQNTTKKLQDARDEMISNGTSYEEAQGIFEKEMAKAAAKNREMIAQLLGGQVGDVEGLDVASALSSVWDQIEAELANGGGINQDQVVSMLQEAGYGPDIIAKAITALFSEQEYTGTVAAGDLAGKGLDESIESMLYDYLIVQSGGVDAATIADQLRSQGVGEDLINQTISALFNADNMHLDPDKVNFDRLLGSLDFEALGKIITSAIENGLIEGVDSTEGVDINKLILELLSGNYTTETPNVDVPTTVTTEPTVDESVPDKITEAIEEETTTEPVDVQPTVNVTDIETSEESPIEDTVVEKLRSEDIDVDVAANVSLTVAVSDSNAAEMGKIVGEALGGAIASGVDAKADDVKTATSTVMGSAVSIGNFNSAYTKMYGAGKYVMAGFKAGLASKADEIYTLCKQIADKVAETVSSALKVESPSKVFMRIGAFTGEGFEIGLRDSMQNAVKTAQDVVSNMNLNTRVLPDFEGAISGAVTSVYAAENSRPIYLNVNGKSLARVISKDTQQATNNANRRVGLGVGK